MSVPRFWRELDTRYNLIGSYCKITDTYHYPRRSFNPEAGREFAEDGLATAQIGNAANKRGKDAAEHDQRRVSFKSSH